MSLIKAEDVKSYISDYLNKNTVLPYLDDTKIDDSLDFLKAGLLDSFGLIEMISSMEEHFHISVDFDQLDPEKLTLFGSFAGYVSENAVTSESSL